MKRILLTISYDGTNYHGWQVQPNAVTIQQILCDALEELCAHRVNLTGCSRTDAGVHAKEFCCHFDTELLLPLSAYIKGLNTYLPSDIVVLDAKEVSSDFHARYSALGKTYHYVIKNDDKKDAFNFRYHWQIEKKLDLEILNICAKKFIGTHDFYAFSSSGRTVSDTVRTIEECYFQKNGEFIEFFIKGNGFLYNMVRIIVGTCVDIAFGRLPIENIDEAFSTKERSLAGITAPAKGLFLEKIHY